MSEQADGIDFALAAYREEGVWTLAELTSDSAADLDTLAHALRRFPGDGGAIGLVGVDQDFFVVARVAGPNVRVLLSDVTAAEEWEIADSVVEFLGLPLPEDEDDPEPAGDLGIFADQGLSEIDLGIILDDDLYPDEALSEIAGKLGFGAMFDNAIGFSNA
jgi:putative tRNA adenosine deaminase-associated protein